MKKINIIITMLLLSISVISQTAPYVTTTGTQTLTNKTLTAPVFRTSTTYDYATPNSITYLDASKNLKSATLGSGLTLNSGTLTATGTGSTTILTASTGISVSGTAPNYTVTSTLPNVTQSLSISSNTISLSGGGGSVTVPTNSYTAGSNISIISNSISVITSPTFTNSTLTGSTVITGTATVTTPTLSSTGTDIINASFFNSKVPFVTLEQFGAVGNGTTNDAPALVLAIASGKPIFLGQKVYAINTTVSTGSNVTVYGSGRLSILSTTMNASMINVNGSYNTFENVCFAGNSTGSSQTLMFCDGNAGQTLYRLSNKINGCWFLNAGGTAFYVRNTTGSASGAGVEGSFYVSNTVFNGNGNGIYCDTKAEYNTFTGCIVQNSSSTGVTFIAGNCNFVGGQVTTSATGVRIASGTNDSHCMFSGVKINHNTINLACSFTGSQYVFSGCIITVGTVSLTGVGKTMFDGCQLGFTTGNSLTITNSPVTFNGCEFYTPIPTYSLTGTAPLMINTYSSTALMSTPTTSVNARFEIQAGSTTIGPLKINSGTLLTTPVNNMVENDGANFFLTSNGTRQTVLKGASGTYTNSATAATSFTVTLPNTQPNSTYEILTTPQNALTAALMYVSSKTTSTFVVTFLTGLTGTVSFDWTLIQN